jgi:hypothetical protein
MSHQKKPKTEGYEWLEYSFTAFNGSGYEDRSSPVNFVESYIIYNRWKERHEAISLTNKYYIPLLNLAQSLIDNSLGSQRIPSEKRWKNFTDFKNKLKYVSKNQTLFRD